jgi:hypothetical protein
MLRGAIAAIMNDLHINHPGIGLRRLNAAGRAGVLFLQMKKATAQVAFSS